VVRKIPADGVLTRAASNCFHRLHHAVAPLYLTRAVRIALSRPSVHSSASAAHQHRLLRRGGPPCWRLAASLLGTLLAAGLSIALARKPEAGLLEPPFSLSAICNSTQLFDAASLLFLLPRCLDFASVALPPPQMLPRGSGPMDLRICSLLHTIL